MKDKKIKIIAEGAVLESLKRLLGGVDVEDYVAESGDRLIIYQHALVGHATRRNDHSALKKLQQILANPASVAPLHIHLLGFTSAANFGPYSYLLDDSALIGFSRVPAKIDLETNGPLSAQAWRRLTRTASEEEVELGCATYRHGLRSLMAAGRIYLGAAIVGHTKSGEWEKVLNHLQDLAQKEDPYIEFNADELARSLKLHERFHSDYLDILRPEKIRLWVVDDNWEKHGWDIVYNHLLPGKTRGFSDWKSLEKELLGTGERPNILMLDCNLGKGANIPTGLELLRPLRSQWQEVRVVFATAYDDAALALTSLREGANIFFAKALYDITDRQSKDYYLHLLKILKPHPLENAVSALWRNFIEGTAKKDKFKREPLLPPPPPPLLKTLRLGFYLLFSMMDDELWWRGRKWKESDERHLYRAVINLIRAGFPAIKNYFGELPHEIIKVLKGGPHGGAPITFSSMHEVLTYLLDEMEIKLGPQPLKTWSRPWPDYWPYRSPSQLQTDSIHPGLAKDTPLAPHEVADNQGALELTRGKYCHVKCKHAALTVVEILHAHPPLPKNILYEDIVLIDDRGDHTGWFTAVQRIFPGCRTFTNVNEFLKAPEEVNLIILDLRLPNLEKGRQALHKILKWDVSAPVFTISAGHDSVAAIRSLRDGAMDFLSKTLPGHRNLDECFLFADEFVNKCALLREYGRSECRQSWQRLHELRQGPKWADGALERAEEKLDECRKEFNSLTQGMGFSSLLIPPKPAEWSGHIADEITLLLRLRQQIFWLSEKKTSKPDPQRLNYKREYQILPIDYWRWEHVISSNKVSYLVKLSAILAGVIVERLAQWNWSLTNLQPLNSYLWGASVSNRIVIRDEINYINGGLAWDMRNEALSPASDQIVWSQLLSDQIITSVFKALANFYSQHGASLPWLKLRPGSKTRP